MQALFAQVGSLVNILVEDVNDISANDMLKDDMAGQVFDAAGPVSE